MNTAPEDQYDGTRNAGARLRWHKLWAWVRRESLDQRLRVALDLGHFGWAEQMLGRGADINFAPVENEGLYKGYALRQPRQRMTALHLACIRGDFEVAAWLLEHGADTSIRDTWGTNPVQLAAERGHAHIVALLASRGEPLDRGMPVYSTYFEDVQPPSIMEHLRETGFDGNEHLRHIASTLSTQMSQDTPVIEDGVAVDQGDGGRRAPTRF